ncbi:hypothetical protein ASPSYDRAFT_115500, partial [Aspergillus sydowii CBS 593.65]
LALAFTTSVLAQDQDVQLRPSAASDSFPACGVNCEILAQADDACTPPTVPATNRQTYVSCFCQSTLITGLKSNAQSVCGTCTSQSDSQKLQQWYVDFCNSGGKTGSNSGNSNSNDNGNNNNNNNDNNDNNSNSNNDGSDSSASSSSSSNTPAPKSWWDGHYKWVVMVIVLVVAFTTIAVVGVWLKRRHDRKYPNLYHAGASDSRVFQNRSHDSPVPGAIPGVLPARRHDSTNTDSFASSSRTEYVPPNARQAPAPSRLQKSQGVNDIEIREAQR